ncbi:GTPase Era [Magnetovibrio blakemorei]|uniref:GTPase Era n=1 Tax=Magnetovibrio blakemorei TaxID=28181 RepID=A0A1E5QCL2_9PROT|nr:GTPase Era [Magnetovibrio blakemorei]OEJ69425.1 GTPase Era [Magnetovibrio blakemorei]
MSEDATKTGSEDRCGFIAVLGAPNAGKSTLVNRIVGTKVSIVSPKVQTTRARVMGIALQGRAQLVFIDTPGIFEPRRRLDRAMVAAAWGGAGDADISLLLVDADKGIDSNTAKIIERMKVEHKRAHLVLNKVDKVAKPKLLELTSRLKDGPFDEIFMISALDGSGVDDLVTFLAGQIPEGPWHFPEDQVSDMTERLLAAEITREKLYLQLRQELPYSTTVETETWEEFDNGSVKIEQVIFVERDSQKSIILGKNGQMIKQLGADSRKDLEEILDRRVHLFLFVKVREKWGDDPERYRDWGLDFDA